MKWRDFVMKVRRVSAACLLLIFIEAQPVSAEDLTITFKDAAGQATTHYYSKDRVRLNQGATDTIVEFTSGRITTVDHSKKQYTETTFAEVEAANKAATAYMEQSMAKIPPAMREEMVKKLGGVSGEPSVTRGAPRTIAGYSCQTYTVRMGDTMTQDTCNTTALVPPFDVATFQKLSDISVPTVVGMDKFVKAVASLKGMSLMQHVVLNALGRRSETRIEATEVKRSPIESSVFALPAGYRKLPPPAGREE